MHAMDHNQMICYLEKSRRYTGYSTKVTGNRIATDLTQWIAKCRDFVQWIAKCIIATDFMQWIAKCFVNNSLSDQ